MEPIRLGAMCLDTVQQFWTSSNVRIGYLNQSDSGHVSRHCTTILIRQKCRTWIIESTRLGPMCQDTIQMFWPSENVGIGHLNWLDSGPCVQILYTNSNLARMLEGHCTTILIRQKCQNQIFKQTRLRPVCSDTVQCSVYNLFDHSEWLRWLGLALEPTK